MLHHAEHVSGRILHLNTLLLLLLLTMMMMIMELDDRSVQ